MADALQDYQTVLASLHKEFPQFRLVPKSKSSFIKLLNLGLLIITLGMVRGFMHTFTTTIGYEVYTPSRWTSWDWQVRAATLRHEAVHMRQRESTSMFWFSIKYLFLWLPCVFAYFRMKYEMEAYEETMRADMEYYGGHLLRDAKYRRSMISHFIGAQYFWTWPWKRRIEQWYDSTAARLLGG